MIRIRRLAALVVAVAAGSATVAGPAAAAVPTQTAIEGVLLSSGGGPAADGNYTVTVGIYSAETGGNPVWAESGVTVAAKGGQFSYQLGAKTPLAAAALSLPAAWIGIQIGSDPELPRKPLGSSPFALRAAVAEALECSGCLKAGNLDAGVLQPYAKSADLGAYAKTADLSAYAKASDLGAYAKTADLSNYAKASDLADYVKASSLAKVAGTGSYADLKDAPTLHKVATTGSYADLTNQPVMAKLGASCGTNLVLKGIKLDGTYECVSAGIGPDLINEISNDLIWNQFVDSKSGTADVQIKDGFSAGVTDTLTFPDVGLAEKISVNFSGLNSDMTKVVVELYGPGMSSPYILYNGGKTGTALVAKYNDGDALVSGDMNKDWLNKNIKGNWSITVKDIAAIQVPPGTPPFTFDGKFNWSIAIQTLSSKKIQIKGDLIVDGELLGQNASQTRGYRQVVFTNSQLDMTSGSFVNARSMPYAKQKDNTALIIDYTENATIRAYAGGWNTIVMRILIDGAECTSPGKIERGYPHYSPGQDIYFTDNLSERAICKATTAGPILAGNHTITVQGRRGYCGGNCWGPYWSYNINSDESRIARLGVGEIQDNQ